MMHWSRRARLRSQLLLNSGMTANTSGYGIYFMPFMYSVFMQLWITMPCHRFRCQAMPCGLEVLGVKDMSRTRCVIQRCEA
jgi:hypothetical protein